ncbi:MGMT family protein [Pedococcus sp. 5OH_020]|uniref:MGMT family protein n=1 Tax=Pedococcus sp. 5OH_020 TaxID=2989814 RepID=UPI0022E9CA38|nr:MGMT family protein [Pedococcus sp. 5OH_020]
MTGTPRRGPDGPSGLPTEFADDVLEVVDTIPEGMVLTYGDIAELLGRGGPRAVGTVMARYGSDVPWWRVVRAGGYFPQGHEEQALAHYREEGTALVRGQIDGRRVDLASARWSEPRLPTAVEGHRGG